MIHLVSLVWVVWRQSASCSFRWEFRVRASSRRSFIIASRLCFHNLLAWALSSHTSLSLKISSWKWRISITTKWKSYSWAQVASGVNSWEILIRSLSELTVMFTVNIISRSAHISECEVARLSLSLVWAHFKPRVVHRLRYCFLIEGWRNGPALSQVI